MRIALTVVFGVALGFVAPRGALAQNTDDAHVLCAQGGGRESFSGAGGPNDSGIASADQGGGVTGSVDSAADPGSGASGGDGGSGGGASADGGSGGGSLSSLAHGPTTSGNSADAGGGGAGAGLGGSDAGGGAGGCGPDIADVVHRLPVTGSNSGHVGYMGAGFVLLGAFLAASSRLWIRRVATAPDGLVWDAFGPRSR
jgi:hypothetical protein